MSSQPQSQRTFLIGFIVSIALCGLIGAWCVLFGTFGDLEARILGTTASIGAASILGLCSSIAWGRQAWQPVGPIGVGIVSLALFLAVVGIWGDADNWRHAERYFKTLGVACTLAIAFPHIGLVGTARLRTGYEWVRIGTVVAVALLASQISVSIVLEVGNDLWFRMMGVLGIGVACGTLAVPILHRVSAIRPTTLAGTSATLMKLVCPRCEQPQTLPLGRSSCPSCKLKIRIEIDENNCTNCGYPLYMLTSAVCPECGTPVADHAD